MVEAARAAARRRAAAVRDAVRADAAATDTALAAGQLPDDDAQRLDPMSTSVVLRGSRRWTPQMVAAANKSLEIATALLALR